MTQLIRVNFLPTTAHCQCRLKANNSGKQSLIEPYNFTDIELQSLELAVKFGKQFYPEFEVEYVGVYNGDRFYKMTKR